MLGEVVCFVGDAGAPVDKELAMVYLVLDPVIPHVHGACALLFDGAIEDAMGSGIVGFDRSWWLGVAKFK